MKRQTAAPRTTTPPWTPGAQEKTSTTILLVVLACSASVALMIGCAGRDGGWAGPGAPEKVTRSDWTFGDARGSVMRSPRYTVYTTLPPGVRRDALPQVLEGAYAQYRALVPAKPIDPRPMHGYVFAEREQWETFTSRRTGSDAAMYLKIPRGGYTIDDWFVVWSDNDRATFSAAAHEGWHQYVARHFHGRLPPFMEEGVACLFEDVRVEDGLPRWRTSVNPNRAQALATAAQGGHLWPLRKLMGLHAGDVVKLPRARIEAFYAQNWAFARFLLEAEGGRYRARFRQLLADTAAGTAFPIDSGWEPATTRAVLARYLREDFSTIERGYAAFVMRITGGPGAPR